MSAEVLDKDYNRFFFRALMCTGWLRMDGTWLNYMHHDDRAKFSILKFE